MASKYESSWLYAEQYPVETDAVIKARRLSLEMGIEPVGRSIGLQLSSLAVIGQARAILEIGTGVGVSGLALLRHVPDATLTTIDIEPEHQAQAKTVFHAAGIAQARTRLVAGDAVQVLPRLNTGSYDLVHIDANPGALLGYVEQALTIVRTGGTIVIPHVFNAGKVADPSVRDDQTAALRDLLAMVADSPAIAPVLSPVGDGLLTLTRLQ